MSDPTIVAEEEKERESETGDVFTCASTKHLGQLNIEELNSQAEWLHFQIRVGREWYVYQLVNIEKIGEEDAKG